MFELRNSALVECVVWAALLCLPAHFCLAQDAGDKIGIFDGRADIGEVVIPGVARFDAAAKTYTVTAAGENMWTDRDAFYLLWKKVSGDVQLTADIAFPRERGRAHRKAVLIVKQDLAADGVYADVAIHGSGLSALQYRRAKGVNTQDIELNIDFPKTARIVKRGDVISMFLSMHGEPLHQSGASIKLHFDGPFYVGIGLCSHDKDMTESAVFSRVELKKPAFAAGASELFSSVQTLQTEDKFRRAMMVRTVKGRIGAVNWSADGQTLYFNQDGRIKKMSVLGGRPENITLAPHLWCDDNHGLSPDNSQLAVSCAPAAGRDPSLYVVPLAGGTAQPLTHGGSAEFHGWSPDGTTIAFTGVRAGHSDVYAVPSQGGKEKRLTSAGVNDGPDFGPDGKIYFTSDRSGTAQVWRMNADGTQAGQLTRDTGSDRFPHVAPNGKQLVYLNSAAPGKLEDATLRVMNLDDDQSRVLVDVYGGDGTLNAPSWSADNHHFAFTAYDRLPRSADGPDYVLVAPKPDVPVK
jgi:sugar lactone lactonase YvrE